MTKRPADDMPQPPADPMQGTPEAKVSYVFEKTATTKKGITIHDGDEVREKAADDTKLFPVRLIRHYRPRDIWRVVGEPAPAPMPGVAQAGKLWAGTVVELPAEEARTLLNYEYQESEFVGEGAGRRRITRTVKAPIAERADAIPV